MFRICAPLPDLSSEPHLEVADSSAGEGQRVDDGAAAHVDGVAALLVVHADVVLRLMEVEPGGLWGRQQRALQRAAGARQADRGAALRARREPPPGAGPGLSARPGAELGAKFGVGLAPGGSINISQIIMCENVTPDV